jgi:hypothetical protein
MKHLFVYLHNCIFTVGFDSITVDTYLVLIIRKLILGWFQMLEYYLETDHDPSFHIVSN